MITKLTMMHAVLAVAACGSIYLSVREVQRRYISQWRLLAPPILGLGVALGLAVIQIAAGQPGWPFIPLMVAGLAAGAFRGYQLPIEHDMYRPMFAVPQATKLVLVWVALLVGMALAVEIVGAAQNPRPEILRYLAALVAMVCAAAMQGRALALAVRLHRLFAPGRQ